MSDITGFPTRFADVNALLDDLRAEEAAILGDHLVGMYLFGSLTTDDFDEDSDIDVLVVTEGDPTDTVFTALKTMHTRLARRDSVWAIQLEVVYIPLAKLRRYDPAQAQHPHLDRGPGEVLHWVQHSGDWIVQRHVLRERGIVIQGPPLSALIDPIAADELRRAMRMLLDVWADRILSEPTMPQRGGQSYIVLTLCRILYTLKYGVVVSKPVAARWAQAALDPRWQPLIDRAWIGRHHPSLPAEPDDVAETLALVRYALERGRATFPTIAPESV